MSNARCLIEGTFPPSMLLPSTLERLTTKVMGSLKNIFAAS